MRCWRFCARSSMAWAMTRSLSLKNILRFPPIWIAVAIAFCSPSRAQVGSTALSPLQRVAPPFTANKLAILARLRDKDFRGLDAEFESYQQAFEKNPAAELNEKLAFDSFATDDAAVGDLIADWIKAKPNSFAAHLARGSYFSWRGWRVRSNFADSGTASAPAGTTRDYFARSAAELRTALKIRPRLSIAYALLLGEARGEEDRPLQQKIGTAALRELPASFVIREEAMECLYPRWEGSHQQMLDFAQQSQAHAKENPCLHWLLGFVDRDDGETLAIDGALDKSIAALTRAIHEGGDYSGFYFSRGESYLHRELYEQALEDFNRADELSPQDPELIIRRAATLARLERPKDALVDLKFVAMFEAPDDFSTQLHDWAVAAIKEQHESEDHGHDL
jgi:tetratricopeptide (TPR) repeat protein